MIKYTFSVIICGRKDYSTRTTSWGKTNQNFYQTFAKYIETIGFIDYNIYNKIFNRLHAYYSNIVFSQPSFRDGILNIFTESKYKREIKKIGKLPAAFIHTGNFCIPEKLSRESKHFLYTDATVLAGIKYSEKKYSKRYLKTFLKYTSIYEKRLTGIFTFNQWTRDSLIDDFGVEAQKITNVGFGANLTPYVGPKDYTNGLILIVLRRGAENIKGLNLLIEAFKLARQKNTKIRLAVVGTTSEPVDGVDYYEGYPREKTVELFQVSSLYAMPALMEPNGMVYPEALSCQTPILGLDRLAFPEFAGYGKYGFIVEPDPQIIAEKILYAMDNPRLLEKMGREGQEFAIRRYSWDVVVQKMLDTINSCL
jgi:glycosyltransferase involved in cell wall biosynthesis